MRQHETTTSFKRAGIDVPCHCRGKRVQRGKGSVGQFCIPWTVINDSLTNTICNSNCKFEDNASKTISNWYLVMLFTSEIWKQEWKLKKIDCWKQTQSGGRKKASTKRRNKKELQRGKSMCLVPGTDGKKTLDQISLQSHSRQEKELRRGSL